MKTTVLHNLEEIATRLGSTPLNVLMHIRRGLLAAEEIDGAWYVTDESLTAYLETNGEERSQVCSAGCAKRSAGCACG